MKKLLAILSVLVLLVGAFVTLVACDKTPDEKKVMTVSLNPEVEFILDEKDNVVSVNALNEEGNLIVSAESFVGKNAEEATTLFVEIATDTGFLVKGSATVTNNQITVSITGNEEEAQKLYNEVKTSVEAFFSKENISAQLEQAKAMTEQQLALLVAECQPYVDQAKLEALNHMELVEMLYESRKETAEMYSQELKSAYYEAKAFALQQAELEVLKSKVGGLAQTMLEINYNLYTSTVESIENARIEYLVSEESSYQKALATLREKKIEYLQFREEVAQMEQTDVTSLVTAKLTALESAVTLAESALLSAGQSANAILDTLKSTATTAYQSVISAIESASVSVDAHLEEISTKQQEAITTFTTAFETNYANAIQSAKTNWQDMKTQLENDTSAE